MRCLISPSSPPYCSFLNAAGEYIVVGKMRLAEQWEKNFLLAEH